MFGNLTRTWIINNQILINGDDFMSPPEYNFLHPLVLHLNCHYQKPKEAKDWFIM